MSLTVFLALCILGLDFMIYVLFKLLYGDRRSLIVRRVAAQREAARAEAAGLTLVRARKASSIREMPDQSADQRFTTEPPKVFARKSYHTRIA
jgi:hypothetical protein